MPQNRKWLYLLAFVSVVFTFLLAFDVIPVLRGCCGWQWVYGLPPAMIGVGIYFAIIIIYLLGIYITRKRNTGQVVWAWLGFLMLSIAAVGVRGEPLDLLLARTLSPVYTGASSAAVHNLDRFDTLDHILQGWTGTMGDLQQTANVHIALSPPGQVLAHYGLAHLLEPLPHITDPISNVLRPLQCNYQPAMYYSDAQMTSALAGVLMFVWVSLAIFPLYGLGVQFTGDERTSARMTQWLALIPSFLYFTPSWNTLYPALILASFYMLTLALQQRRWWGALAAGLFMSVTTFLNLSVLPVLLFAGLYTLAYWYFIARLRPKPPGFWWTVQIGILYGVGLSVVWVWFGLYSGLTPLDIIQQAFEKHLAIERNYWIWLVLHIYDVILFSGVSLVGLALLGWSENESSRRTPAFALGVALVLTIGIMVISGTARGETGRVWMFFSPFFLLVGIGCFKKSSLGDVPLLLTQALYTFVLIVVLVPMDTFLDPAPVSPRAAPVDVQTLPLIPVDKQFETPDGSGIFRLVSYHYIADPSQQAITLQLVWEGIQPTHHPYVARIIARADDEQGRLIETPAFWHSPQGGHYLTSCWRDGQIIFDQLILDMPTITAPVEWELSLQMVNRVRNRFMRVAGTNETTITFEPIPYP